MVLTYMSIRDEIKAILGKELFVLLSEFGGEETPRTIYYSIEVREIIEGATSSGKNKMRFSSAKAVMDAFIELGEILFGLDPHNKSAHARMARTDPVSEGVVDFRVLDPSPGIRVFGCFSEPDTFIALTWRFREEMDSSGEFDAEIARCKDKWRQLFPTAAPHIGTKAYDYVTENFLAV